MSKEESTAARTAEGLRGGSYDPFCRGCEKTVKELRSSNEGMGWDLKAKTVVHLFSHVSWFSLATSHSQQMVAQKQLTVTVI